MNAPRPRSRPRVEPSAAQRHAAKEMRSLFVALTDEGFTSAEALQMIGAMLSAAMPKPPDSGSAEPT